MNKHSERPIGIFDSGIGGLTVANAIHHLMPDEQLIYFGDTAHLPYGDKSAEAIKSYSNKIAGFLMEMNCKAIVIACNTASSVAFKSVQKLFHDKDLVINVIDPVVENVLSTGNISRVGIIATKRTIKSNIYAKKLKALQPGIEVASLATPLLAPMIEEGFFNNKISQTIINSYLSKPKLKNIESLILACTHYPLIEPEINKFYKNKIKIVDSPQIVANRVKEILATKNLLRKTPGKEHHFFVSDYTGSFEQTSRIFFREKIKLELKNIWNT